MIARVDIESANVSKHSVKDRIVAVWTRTPRTELRKLVQALRAKRADIARLSIAHANAPRGARLAIRAELKELKAEVKALETEIKAGRAGTRYRGGAAVFAALQGATSAGRTLTRSERRDLREIIEEVAQRNGVSVAAVLAVAA